MHLSDFGIGATRTIKPILTTLFTVQIFFFEGLVRVWGGRDIRMKCVLRVCNKNITKTRDPVEMLYYTG